MKQITTTKATILVVDVPEGASLAGYIAETNHLYYWTQNCTQSMGDYPYSIVVSEGNWTVLGRAKELTEEQWREVVPNEKHFVGPWPIFIYVDYINKECYFDNATESGHSLLKANGIVTNPLILKLE